MVLTLPVTDFSLPNPTDHRAFLTVPTAAATLQGLAPGTASTVRARGVVGDGVARWELPWSGSTLATTLRLPRHAAADHPPVVVRVLGTTVTLQVRNPGADLPAPSWLWGGRMGGGVCAPVDVCRGAACPRAGEGVGEGGG